MHDNSICYALHTARIGLGRHLLAVPRGFSCPAYKCLVACLQLWRRVRQLAGDAIADSTAAQSSAQELLHWCTLWHHCLPCGITVYPVGSLCVMWHTVYRAKRQSLEPEQLVYQCCRSQTLCCIAGQSSVHQHCGNCCGSCQPPYICLQYMLRV